MGFEIIWSDFAESQLDKIYEYYVENVNIKVARNILSGILKAPDKLIENVEICQIEDLLIDREEQYRYIVYNNYKIIYSVNQKKKLIKIADVFDTRQNPTKMQRNK